MMGLVAYQKIFDGERLSWILYKSTGSKCGSDYNSPHDLWIGLLVSVTVCMPKGIYTSRETLGNSLFLMICTFFACLQ